MKSLIRQLKKKSFQHPGKLKRILRFNIVVQHLTKHTLATTGGLSTGEFGNGEICMRTEVSYLFISL